MCLGLLKAHSLDTINYIDMKTLCAFFNIPTRPAFEDNLNQLKKSIGYIILIERYDENRSEMKSKTTSAFPSSGNSRLTSVPSSSPFSRNSGNSSKSKNPPSTVPVSRTSSKPKPPSTNSTGPSKKSRRTQTSETTLPK